MSASGRAREKVSLVGNCRGERNDVLEKEKIRKRGSKDATGSVGNGTGRSGGRVNNRVVSKEEGTGKGTRKQEQEKDFRSLGKRDREKAGMLREDEGRLCASGGCFVSSKRADSPALAQKHRCSPPGPASVSVAHVACAEVVVKRGRGRPRKYPIVPVTAVNALPVASTANGETLVGATDRNETARGKADVNHGEKDDMDDIEDATCQGCCSSKRAADMLLCDACDAGWHIGALDANPYMHACMLWSMRAMTTFIAPFV